MAHKQHFQFDVFYTDCANKVIRAFSKNVTLVNIITVLSQNYSTITKEK